MEWLSKYAEIIVTALISLAGGAIASATFVLRMKRDVELIQLTTSRIEEDVQELKQFKNEFIATETKIELFEGDLEEIKSFVKDGKQELAIEFTRTINNVVEMMKEYMKRNDGEVDRLRDKYHEISNQILTALLNIQMAVKKQ